MMKYLIVLLPFLLVGRLAAESGEITLFTERHYEFDDSLYELFQKKTGVKVNVVKASGSELIARLREEGETTKADLYMTADAGSLEKARLAGLLKPFESEVAKAAVPASLREPGDHWIGVTRRTRVIAYAKDRVKPSELSTYEALAGPEWRARVVVRSSSNAYNQSLLATIIAAVGAEEAERWATGVRKNMARPPQGSDRDQVRAVAAGLADVAIVNTYYLGLLEASEDPRDREAAAAVKVFFPNQEGRGAHINISGLGVVKASKKADLAAQFIEFLVSEEVQGMVPEGSFEYPVVESVPWSELQLRWGKFKADEVSLSKLGEWNAEAVRIFNRAGWE